MNKNESLNKKYIKNEYRMKNIGTLSSIIVGFVPAVSSLFYSIANLSNFCFSFSSISLAIYSLANSRIFYLYFY